VLEDQFDGWRKVILLVSKLIQLFFIVNGMRDLPVDEGYMNPQMDMEYILCVRKVVGILFCN